ncbi:Bacitracin export ATP-binding protein BceA [Aestuariimicrobium sp. T2.26MG-19.2B]|uniref:ABC transporter ATP-binding protein n=1 Tax=Aestuariimicrobium sp. T2.26MG-19.2B TaxID=3040679 RepID=UPI0024777FAC|nr:ABC transporter ATP-binding protein [Aestuariimicrobium sp. T2.26MG-19.2B]CAI9403303.1 Bacitracin export ATP-binding protein BceA [Aestuariimicrobium sp. T2.26MG-19.2B]
MTQEQSPARRAMSPTLSPVPTTGPSPAPGLGPVAGQPGARSSLTPSVVAEARDLVKVYGTDKTQVVALDRVSVSFQRGSFTAIMGPSGSGKSTLMHCLAGLDRITAGQVFLAGEELNRLPDSKLTNVRRDRLGFVFQSFNLLPTLTARQNIVLPLDLAGRKPDEAWVTQLAESLGLTDRLTHRPSELSGGQQQRVAIARAMVTRPDVIFADEPTGALDSKTGTALLNYLRRSVDDLGQSIIMVTHDPKAAAYADRVLVLLDGHIVDDLTDPDVDQVTHALATLER